MQKLNKKKNHLYLIVDWVNEIQYYEYKNRLMKLRLFQSNSDC